MSGGGGQTAERSPFQSADLPALLVRLDGDESRQQQAIEAVRATVDDRPDAVVPTVPKLRALLTEPTATADDAPSGTETAGLTSTSTTLQTDAAYCLAELAAFSPEDVAPSAGELASFVADSGDHPATPDVLRCLSSVAETRPEAVADHARPIVDALECARPTARATAAVVLTHVASSSSSTGVPGESSLLELLADDDPTVRSNACTALAEGRVEAARGRLETLAADDPVLDVRDRATQALSQLS